MVSPLCEVNSASLGAWTSTQNAVVIAAGELVSIRLQDSAGVVWWDLLFFGTDELTPAPVLTVNTGAKTASFTAPADVNGGYAFSLQSTVGVGALGKDSNFAVQVDYVSRFKLGTLAASGIMVGTVDETLEASSEFGWLTLLNPVIRNPPGSGAAPTGAAGGNLSGTYPNPVVAKINGATVPAAGALTIGNVLQVTGVSAVGYAPVNLAGGANFVTGTLPLANIGPGSNGQVLTTAGGVPVWATIVDANVSASAAIAVSKLAPGSNGQVLSTSGGVTVWAAGGVAPSGISQGGATTGQALIWNGANWAPGTNFSNQNLVTTGSISVSAITDTGLGLGVVHSSAGGAFTSSLVVNADVNAAAAIAVTKLATGVLGQVLQVQAGPVNGWSTDFYVKPDAFSPYTDLYLGEGITPSASNYSMSGNGTTETAINVANAGGAINFYINNVLTAGITTSDIYFWPDVANPRLYQGVKQTNAATADLTIQSQQPFASATGANRNSGNLNLVTPAPVSGGTGGSVFIKPAATTALTLSAAGALRLNAYTTAGFLKNDTSGNVTSSPLVAGDFLGQLQSVADIPALQALDTAGFNDAAQVMVRELWQIFILVRSNTDAQDLSYYTTVDAKQGGGTNGKWLMEAA
jgi:hypothetical protein